MPESLIRPFLYRASAYALVAAVTEGLAWFLFDLDVRGLAGTILVATIIAGPLLCPSPVSRSAPSTSRKARRMLQKTG
jgi:hypothetical protein